MVEFGELLKLSKNEKRLYDSIENQYFSQLHLLKEKNGNNFYLTIDPNTSVLLKKVKKVNQISSDEIVDFPLISLDSLIKIIPGMEYLQLKNSDKVKFIDDLNFYIIEPEPDSRLFGIYRVEPIMEHVD